MVDAPRDEDAAALPARGQADAAGSGDMPLDTAVEDAAALDPRRAYEVLEIRTPLEEFEGYVRARIDTLSRLGETEKAELAAKALEVGRRALARVTGAGTTQEKSQ